MEITVRPNQTLVVPVTESSQIGEARRVGRALADRLGFSEPRQEDVAIIVSEAAHNLVQHGGGGQLLIRKLHCGKSRGLEVMALDRGPGMTSVSQCLQDRFSTTGTTGTGLGAIQRLSDSFDIHSLSGRGTAILARLWTEPVKDSPWLEVGGVCVAKPGQTICGDIWDQRREMPPRSAILVADGLGHGPLAADASNQARDLFLNSDLPPGPLLAHLHEQLRLRKLRGAAVGIAEFVPVASVGPTALEVHYWGVGNIGGVIVSGSHRSNLVSRHGTLGVALPRLEAFVYPWQKDSLLILSSDGLNSQWRLERYPGLKQRDAALIAGILYRDFQRGNDDVAVVVARARRQTFGPAHGC